jgi:hypothetical protein
MAGKRATTIGAVYGKTGDRYLDLIGVGIAESTISAVPGGKRKRNRAQIAKLARCYHVEPGVFLSEG